MIWYLILLMAHSSIGSPLFGQYQTEAECQDELKPLKDANANQPWACLTGDRVPSIPEEAGWVNGPLPGSWDSLGDDFNEKARRGLWRHSRLDYWRVAMADSLLSDKDPPRPGIPMPPKKIIYDRILPEEAQK